MKIFSLFIALLFINTSTFASDELDTGPGIFSGKTGEFSLFKSSTSDNIEVNSTQSNTANKDEFALFKVWKQERDKNTVEYQEFLLWVEYQKYLKR